MPESKKRGKRWIAFTGMAVLVGLLLLSACGAKGSGGNLGAKDGAEVAGGQEGGSQTEGEGQGTGSQAEDSGDGAEEGGQKEGSSEGADEGDAPLELLKSFQAEALDGGTFTEADLADKDLTVIHFWSTSCGPCITEMPELAAFEAALPDRVQLVTVCLDGSRGAEEAEEILAEAGFQGRTLLSGDGDFLELCYAIMYTPTTVFIDSDGCLAGDVIVGSQGELEKVYTEAVNAALEELGKEALSLDEG